MATDDDDDDDHDDDDEMALAAAHNDRRDAFVICNPTLVTEPEFAMLAYAPQRQEPVTPVTPRLIQQVCARESLSKNLGKDFLVAA